MGGATQCEGCDGTGIRAPATPLCALEMPGPGWIVVERCDTCCKYPSDEVAARARYDVVRVVLCANGAEHVIALPDVPE